ncbi:MAG TPA: hypothetical protein VMF69_11350 [Gemmataceae bacterium]|nr:hypothetical protein [Gemmataceae bacterium]
MLQRYLFSILPKQGFRVKLGPGEDLAKFPSGIDSLGIKIVVLPLSPSPPKIHAVKIEMKGAGVGDSFLKSRPEIESEVCLGQTFPSPMAIAGGAMAFGKYLDRFSLPQNRMGWYAGLHPSSGRGARMTQS